MSTGSSERADRGQNHGAHPRRSSNIRPSAARRRHAGRRPRRAEGRLHPEHHARSSGAAVEHALDRFVDLVERALRALHPSSVPRACSAKTSSRSCRVPTIEPITVRPPSTVWKIGRPISFSAGRPTHTSVPPRASEASACSNAFGLTAVAIATWAPPSACMAATGSCSLALTACEAPSSSAVSSRVWLMSTAIDLSAGDRRVLDGKMSEPADTEDRDAVGGTRARDLDGLVGGHSGAGERRGVGRIDSVGDAHDVAGVADRVLGEAAVDRVAHVLLRFAERLAPAIAISAVATGIAEPRQRDAHTDLDSVAVARTDALDDPDPLVAWDERRRRLDRPVALGGMDVGVAQPTGLDPDEDLLRARLGHGTVLDDERLVEAANDGGLHERTSVWSVW